MPRLVIDDANREAVVDAIAALIVAEVERAFADELPGRGSAESESA